MENERPGAEESQGTTSVAEKDNAPETRQAQVEGTGSRPEGQADSERRGGPDPFQAQKRVTDKLLKKMEKLEEFVTKWEKTQGPSSNGVQVQQSPQTSAPQGVSEFWSDPENYIDKKIAERTGHVERNIEKGKAEQYVLSQDYIDPDKDMEYLADMVQSNGLDQIQDPWKAANALLKIVKADRGLGARTVAKSTAQQVRGTPVGLDKGIFNADDVKKMSLEDYEKNRANLMEAAREGKLK